MLPSQPALDLDKGNEDGFCSFFRKLPVKDTSLIRIFDRGDYFTVHGEDAVTVAQNVYKTQSVLKYIGHSDPTRAIPSCTMSSIVFQTFVRDCLINRGLRIEIWTAESKGGRNWTCTRQASPGNLRDIEDLVFRNSDNTSDPVLMAVKISAKADQKTVGTCFSGAKLREIGMNEFTDNELYSNFESLVIQLGVKECLLQADEQKKDFDLTKLRTILERCGIIVTEVKSSELDGRDVDSDLARLVSVPEGAASSATNLAILDLKLACGAANALINYLGLSSDVSNFGAWTISRYDLSQYMKLDASALKALSLMPGPLDGANKSMSVYGLLNYCKTSLGQRLLAQWLKQPLMDLQAIEERMDLVEIFYNRAELRDTVQHEHLRFVPDLYRLSKKFQKGAAGLEDVVRVYQVVVRLPGLLGALQEEIEEPYADVLKVAYTTKLEEHITSLAKLQDLVETTIDLNALEHHEFLIKADFDENLQNLKIKIDETREEITAEHLRIADDLNQDPEKKLKLEQHTSYGFCLRLTRAEASCIRGKRDYSELSTQKAGVYFTSNSLGKLSKAYTEFSTQYNRHQSGLVKEVVTIAASYCPVLELLGGLIAHLDVIVSFAHSSMHAPTPYIRPTMHARGTGNTILKEARHPCLEVQDSISFIANDISLIRDQSEFLIITGPNMGGKSTYIRQVGVIALMAQIGCFVPCSEAELSIFDSILARVGAGDSQLKGISTFMAEMLETATILRSATRDSLIIIDELGRGTSTTDGFGLAWAISEHIVKNIGCFALFATHFHELTALADEAPQVKNLHVIAYVGDERSDGQGREITLLYKVEDGVCDQSFGIHVAQLARFPSKVVNMAKRKAEELESFSGETGVPTKATKVEVEEGTRLVMEIMRRWKERIRDESMDRDAMVSAFRDILADHRDALASNPWIKEVQALA